MFTVAAGAGVSCCTTGAVVSANVAVSENACEIVSGSGFVELVTSPVQPTNPQPAVGVAVSVTLEPNAYLGWSGLFATEPRPAIVTATVKLSVSMLAAMVWLACTLMNVYVVIGPTSTPSTSTPAT